MDVSNEQEVHNILTIPPELCELIITELEPESLLSLRQASHETCQRVDKQFCKTFFHQKAFLLSREDSLRRLLDIAGNDRFARSMRTLELMILESPAMREFDVWTAPVESLHYLYQTSKHFDSLAYETLPEDHLPPRGEQVWDDIIEERRAFQYRGHDLALLTDCLSQLKKRRSTGLEIRIINRFSYYQDPYGLTEFERSFGDSMRNDSPERFIALVLTALKQSALEVVSLGLPLRHEYTQPLSLFDGRITMDLGGEAFRHLKKLHFDFQVQDRLLTNGLVAEFCELVSHVPQVEDLTFNVSFQYDMEWDPVSYAALKRSFCGALRTKLPVLKKLDLQHFEIPTEIVLETLSGMKTLETFHYHPHRGQTHRPNWGDLTSVAGSKECIEVFAPTQREVDLFRASLGCRTSVKIATCTLLEWFARNRGMKLPVAVLMPSYWHGMLAAEEWEKSRDGL